MRLTIFGATGGTGNQLVEQALAAEHQIVTYKLVNYTTDPKRLVVGRVRVFLPNVGKSD